MGKMIPQTSPKAGYLALKSQIDNAIQRVLDSGIYILGQEVEAFEQEFADYIGVPFGIALANGTDALELALRACQVGEGDVVITVSHTAVATVAAIELAGATPYLVDIDPLSYTLDLHSLAEGIEQIQRNPSMGRLRAIVPVHLYGHPANMPAIMELAQRYQLIVIEDCSQSHGATLNRQKTGTWGHLATFSLYPTKNLGALGDAGIVVTADPALADRVKSLRQYGWKQRYISDISGGNSRLDALQAAILRVKLQALDQENACRQEIAQHYHQGLACLPLKLPVSQGEVSHVYHQYVVRVQQRESLMTYLKNQGIGTALHYPTPVHLQPAYRGKVPIAPSLLPVTEAIMPEILSLPMHPYLSLEEVQQIIAAIEQYYSPE